MHNMIHSFATPIAAKTRHRSHQGSAINLGTHRHAITSWAFVSASAALLALVVAPYSADERSRDKNSSIANHSSHFERFRTSSTWHNSWKNRSMQPNDATFNICLPRKLSPQICQCEKNNTISPPTSSPPQPLSRFSLLLYHSKFLSHSSLPIPRLLTPRDPLFSYPELQRGLRRRRHDETRLRELLSSPRLQEARAGQDQKRRNGLFEEVNELVYGKGVTPQSREDFLIRFGCTGHTPSVVEYLAGDLGERRGFVEVGAGNGQWARALTDRYSKSRKERNETQSNSSSFSWEFVLAYDTMEDLPLSPLIYHRLTLPYQQYFYHDVKRCQSHIDAVQGYASRGRVLLLVYPPPGPMAVETVQAYVDVDASRNDTVVYVGEGRGGANANDDFFDYFLGKKKEHFGDRQDKDGNATSKTSQCVLLKVMDVQTCPGVKGYYKMFDFQRV